MAYAVDDITTEEQTPLPALYPAPVFATVVRQLDFGVVRKPARKSVPFKVSNIGGRGILKVQFVPSPDPGWLRVHPARLEIPAGEDRIVEAEVDTGHAACPEGRQTLGVEISAPDSIVPASPRIPVSIEVLEEIRLVLQPAECDLGVVPQGEGRTVSVQVTRSDGFPVDVQPQVEVLDHEGAPRRAWADVQLGRPGREQQVTLTFHTANRAQQEYRCAVRLFDTAAEVSPAEVVLRVQVGPPPTLEVGLPAPMPLFPGGMRSAALTLRNAGGGVLKGRAGSDQGWLQLRGSEFEVRAGETASLPLTLGHARLTPGVHTGTLEIESNDGGRVRVRKVPLTQAIEDEAKATPVEVQFEGNAGDLPWGQSAQIALSIHNRMGQPFEGSLKSGSPDWLQVPEGAITIAPGESAEAKVTIDTNALAREKTARDYASWVRVIGGGWKVCWTGRATVRVLPKRRSWGLFGLLLAAALLPAGYGVVGLVQGHSPGGGPAPVVKPAGRADPARARVHYVEGQVAFNRKEFTRAARWFEDAARFDPNPAGCHVMLGRCFYELGDLDRAEAALRKALSLRPDSAAAKDWLARVRARRR